MCSCKAHICDSVLIQSTLSAFSLMGFAWCHLLRSGPQRVPPTTPTPHSSHTHVSLALVSVCFSYHRLMTWCVIFILSASPSVCAVFFFLKGGHCWGVSDAQASFSLSAVVIFTEYTVYCGRTPRHLPLMTSVSALCGANGPATSPQRGGGCGADRGGHRARRRGEREGNDEGKTVFSITSPFRFFTPLIPE